MLKIGIQEQRVIQIIGTLYDEKFMINESP